MKKIVIIFAMICIVLLMGCITKQNKNKLVQNIVTSNKNIQQDSVEVDSAIFISIAPTTQEIYIFDEKRTAEIGKLLRGANTEKKEFKYYYNNSGDEAKVILFYIKDRIVAIQKRIFDLENTEVSFSIYDFNGSNKCFSNTQWTIQEKKSYTLTTYNDSLIYYDNKSNVINIDFSQKQKLVQTVNDSLVSLMKFFPEFKYSSDLK